MDLISRTRCKTCEHIFCCADHRRKHEAIAHKSGERKRVNHVKPYKHVHDSYPLGMRRSFLYLEERKAIVNEFKRKRSLMVSKTFVETKETKIEVAERKILVPVFRKKGKMFASNKSKNNEIEIIEDHYRHELITGIISPVEPVTKELPNDFVSPNYDNVIKCENIFTTSTPILQEGIKNVNIGNPGTPLQSAKKSVLRVNSGKSFMKRKVTFSESIDSLYSTAQEESIKFTGNGLISTVTNAFQAALAGFAGRGDAATEGAESEDKSPRSIYRQQRASDYKITDRQKLPIQGRRPLHSKLSTFHLVKYNEGI